MGKITKSMQPKHKETLSPWVKDYVQAAATVPLPLLPSHLDTFPTTWPFPRGDLYHWIPLLNRFDNILDSFNKVYKLEDGLQSRDFGCDLLLGRPLRVDNYGSATCWDEKQLAEQGYKQDGDSQLIVAVLKFSRTLLDHCGNRSIYASSPYLNDLLNSTSLTVIHATLEVGFELAQRYQASVKRMSVPSRQVSNALLANHYQIDLDRVQQIAQPFVKTPIISLADSAAQATPASGSKVGEKTHAAATKNAASMYANDLVSIASADDASGATWNGWGDIKIAYYPKSDSNEHSAHAATSDRNNSTTPTTPTPLRRSTTMGSQQQTSRGVRVAPSADESPSPSHRSPAVAFEGHTGSSQKSFEVPHNIVSSMSIYDVLKRVPSDLSKASQYEFLNRVRISKALLGSTESRQQALAVRLMAILNLAFIHSESTFAEHVLKQDHDEPRRYQLVYQLAELISPSAKGQVVVPRWLQQSALKLLECISYFPSKYPDVLSALNANVNHGVLLYVIRKAVAEMKEDTGEACDKRTDADDWRRNLFSLTLHMAIGSRVGNEMISAGLMEILVEILNMRSKVADRNHSMVLAFLDGLIYNYQGAFQAFITANGLDSIALLIVDTVSSAKQLTEAGLGTKPEFHTKGVDYEIPYYQQQTLKWLLKFIHHIMTNSYAYGGGNTDRLLRNLVDNSQLLGSLTSIMENMQDFGSVVWTNSVTILSDFINNDPTSFAAISESGMIKTYLESITGRPILMEQASEPKSEEPATNEDGEAASPADEAESPVHIVLESDGRPHPPTLEMLQAPRQVAIARGVLPSSEAIGSIIPTLNSISLNNVGMKMVVSSHALDSFLEIFESPEHVKAMEADADIASNVGAHFDELARHHPALRPTIANAVLDMVARVNHLGKTKAVTVGWGAKLLANAPNGKVITAGKSLLQDSAIATSSSKGKEKALSEDVDMIDVTEATGDSVLSQPDSTEGTPEPTTSNSFNPYILVVSTFLSAYNNNTNLRKSFIRDGGTELLLDLTVLPSLTHDYADSPASRTLQSAVSHLIEDTPIIGLPSLLNRTQAAVDALSPLVSAGGSPWSHLFLKDGLTLAANGETSGDGDWDEEVLRTFANGTDVVKALLNAQSLLKTLYSCFPYNARHSSVTLPAINVYDQYSRLVKSLGPLLRSVLAEETAIAELVPASWLLRKSSTERGELTMAPTTSPPGDAEAADTLLADLTGNIGEESTSSAKLKRPTEDELSSPQYQNFQVLRDLLHSLMPATFPFFQTLGKALMPKRERTEYLQAKHMQTADALAETILNQLVPLDSPSTKHFHYNIIMLHTVHEMLIDSTRPSERQGVHVIIPVLDAFLKRGGLDVLNSMLSVFADEITKEHSETSRLASVGMKKIFDLYVLIVNAKNIHESILQLSVSHRPGRDQRSPESHQSTGQLIVDLRMAVLPLVRQLWESKLVEKASTEVLSKTVDILKTICTSDVQENQAWHRNDGTKPQPPPMFKREPVFFNWTSHNDLVKQLTAQYDVDLAQEAVYRAIGVKDHADQYCRVHKAGIAGARNPVPSEESNMLSTGTPSDDPIRRTAQDSMTVDPVPVVVDQVSGEAIFGELGNASSPEDHSSQSSSDSQSPGDAPSHHESVSISALNATEAAASSSHEQQSTNRPIAAKEDLDAEREKLRKDLIDRCLDVIRAHPNSVFEVSELISVLIIQRKNEEARQELGETLANALMSFAIDDEVKKSSGRSIAAYAHLLSLLLQEDKTFLESTVKTLKDNVAEYLGFLKIPPGNSSEELPPWIPYILLIFEILLADDEQPAEAKWKAPTSENDTVEAPVLQVKDPTLKEADRAILLEAVLDTLPRIGKEEALAVAVLRVLVILTRNRSDAKIVGHRKNLQRLFVMAKQLSALGSARLKELTISGSIMSILRHIVEDEDTVRQIMRHEIRKFFETPSRNPARSMEIATYTRHLAHVALRSPNLFVDVTNEMVKLVHFVPANPSETGFAMPRGVHLTLKESKETLPSNRQASNATAASIVKDESVEPTVQATEELTINDVKPTTESADKEMVDAGKSFPLESKRPIVENPDGVMHFLLCELLNYREVDDKESPPAAKESKDSSETASATLNGESSSVQDSGTDKDKDKKSSKPTFKAGDHPIFVYRCFLLHCLTELLQSYTRAKMEFINFKRSAPMLGTTPVKPRSGVLNYLLNDLLCISSLTTPMDSVAAKKKAATSEQARLVLVALVDKTGEKPVDKSRERYAYDDDPDLLFVRRWVLDTILRAYKESASPHEPFDVRYAKMLSLAELMSGMIGDKDRDAGTVRSTDVSMVRSQMQLKRLMYEKAYLPALTASIADIDLTFPGVKRTIKYILRVLQVLTNTGIQLSQSNLLPSGPQDSVEDEIASASSLSDMEDDREETPDLYRNSALGMLEPGREEEYSENSEDDDEEMYDDEYPEELDYGDDMSEDGDENVSDEDEELGGMGHIEGLPGDPVGIEVIMEDDDDEDMEDDDDDLSDDDDEDDDEVDSDDMEELEEQVEMIDEEGNVVPDDGASGWESETDDEDEGDDDGGEVDYEGEPQDLDEVPQMHALQEQLMREGLLTDPRHNAIMGDDGFFDDEEIRNFDDRYGDEGEDDDEDEEEDVELDEDYIYDPDYPRPGAELAPPAGLGWDTLMVDPALGPRHRHGGMRSPFPVGPFVIGGGPRGGEQYGDFRNYFRSNRPGPTSSANDGVNPLLRRANSSGRDTSPRPSNASALARLGAMSGFLDSNPMAIISDLVANMPPSISRAGGLSFSIAAPQGGHVHEFTLPFPGRAGHHGRDARVDSRRDVYQDPQLAVGFTAHQTVDRWLDEAKMVFGSSPPGYLDKASKLVTLIWAQLTPAAIEQEKKLKAEQAELRRKEDEKHKQRQELRKAVEAKEAEAKAAREKEEEEAERERQEREQAEAVAHAEPTSGDAAIGEPEGAEPQPMDGVEATGAAEPTQPEEPAADLPRVVTTIRGEEVDVTELGIDPEYLAALPEEFREEVIAQTLTTRRTEAREAAEHPAGEQTEVFQEFLDALPEDLRHEIVQQERVERRRAEREAQRRQATAAAGHNPVPQEMDTASILLTFPEDLREQILMEQGEDLMESLPPDMAAQARALVERSRPAPSLPRIREAVRRPAEPAAATDNKAQRRTVVQMLDKAGVATLIRLMFMSHQGSMRTHLFRVLGDICENRLNRVDVVSTLLQILHFGSIDMDAVERSFSTLSLKAKQPKDKDIEKDQKTPNSLKRTYTNISATSTQIIQNNSEVSPLMIVQQCLDLLVELSTKNPHVPSFFLTEHEAVSFSPKRSLSRKGKGKEVRANKYAINMLLHLLDRDLVMESSTVMQLLVDLLNKVTFPLQALERRRKEAEEQAKKAAEKAVEAANPVPEASATVGIALGANSDAPAEITGESTSAAIEASTAETQQPAEAKKIRQLQPPLIPETNLKLVVNIFVARECSSKTFQNTISTIKNLSNIPGAKVVFGLELVRQANVLSQNIVSDLDDLLPHILKAESGTEIQGIALAKFSPGASEQNKLLRVLTALDHLFDTKKQDEKSELLGSLYHNETFGQMWEKLSACLGAIQQRDSMLNVATILLPLIESLMVVCKNTTLQDAPQGQGPAGKDLVLTSPPPENRMAGLFFTFTEDHRKILNELVRHNPKLMSGTFSLLVKNPKVLEFDNKRNYFNRSVHSKNANQTRPNFPPLGLSVRREHVFHDSFKSLYFKGGDEMKYGKLNIRFHGEEGVDAGGVTREWFQVLARQMFDPNYALFIPVSSDRTTFHPNKLSGINDEHLMFFKFIGRIIGKALYEGRLLDCYFSRAVYKRILGKTVSVKDMESFDPDYYKSLVWMLENDITDIITETFSVEDDEFGATKIVDLCENGRDIPVTDENKHEYVRLVVEHKLLASVTEQMEQFLLGFHEIIPAELIAIFNEQELELLISGLPDIDVDDWKSNTEYHNYTAASQQIQWFWRAIRSFDKEERAKLLQFVTGTSKVPLNGFKELEGMNGVNRFNIHRDYGNKERLPSSHTCFNQIDLPEYESYETLRTRLHKAITAGSDYFGFA